MSFFKNKWTWIGIAVVLVAAWIIVGGDVPMISGGETPAAE